MAADGDELAGPRQGMDELGRAHPWWERVGAGPAWRWQKTGLLGRWFGWPVCMNWAPKRAGIGLSLWANWTWARPAKWVIIGPKLGPHKWALSPPRRWSNNNKIR